VGRDLNSLILRLPGLYTSPPKLALPELGLNKAEGRSKRPCDAISTRQLAQSSQHVDGEDDDDDVDDDDDGGGGDDDVEEHED